MWVGGWRRKRWFERVTVMFGWVGGWVGWEEGGEADFEDDGERASHVVEGELKEREGGWVGGWVGGWKRKRWLK